MLIELWERLRGYDKWVQTEAKIESSELEEKEVASSRDRYGNDHTDFESASTCWICWTDTEGKEHRSFYEVWEDSPLYQLYDGQSITIRYNPANAEQFYIRGVLQSQAITTFKWRILPAAIAMSVFIGWLIVYLSAEMGHRAR
jgi:hypothetical protein